MRTRNIFAATAALLCLASAAHAATASGIVQDVSWEERTLTLDSGTHFMLSPRVQEQEIEAGDQVVITWNGMRNGIRVANIVRVSEEPAE